MISASPGAVRSEGTTSRSRRWPILALVAWTLFVWVGRIRNVLADPTLDATTGRTPLLLSTVFVSLGLLVGGAAAVSWRSGSAWRAQGRLRLTVMVLASWTAAVWVLRMFGILAGGHDVGFVVVHLILAVVSVALAGLAVLEVRWDRARDSTEVR